MSLNSIHVTNYLFPADCQQLLSSNWCFGLKTERHQKVPRLKEKIETDGEQPWVEYAAREHHILPIHVN
ncbi:MAG: hypothetical protein OXC60_17000 [Litoreibacter sp.]|nr:hypothetical protein [Litoreibacter sp.]